MLSNALLFLVKTLLDLLTVLFLLRFFFQLLKVPFQNQVAQMIVTLTNFAVKPVRKVIPSLGKLDISTLLLAYLCQLFLTVFTLWLSDYPLMIVGTSIWVKLFAIAVLGITTISLTIFLYAVLIHAVLSWINPHTPITPILNSLTNPILKFLRKFIPLAGNIDLTPLAFIITAQLLLMTILIPMETNLVKSIIS